MVIDAKTIARKRARWQGRANVERFAEQIDEAHAAQRLKNNTEIGIIHRFIRGERLLDVGIGTGRVSLPLLQYGFQLTGVDASAAMIQRCASDTRAMSVRLVKGEIEQLPFAHETFDTVISVDTFTHFPDWATNLDELVRVTRLGGRILVDVGSRDHLEAVAQARGISSAHLGANDGGVGDASALWLSSEELQNYATEREVTLVALVPYGAILGSLVPNYWIANSYAARSGGIDRLVSWLGADPLLFAWAEFIERRIVQQLPTSTSSRMFAVFERDAEAEAFRQPPIEELPLCDERGPQVWLAELDAHAQHEPNRAFALAFLLAAWPLRLPTALRAVVPAVLSLDIDRMERASHIDDICSDVVTAWRSTATDAVFHGVDLTDVFGMLLKGELRDRLEANE